MRTPTIEDVRDATIRKSPYFFSRDSMKHFGQTMRMFRVERSPMGRIFIYAPMWDYRGQDMGYTFREFADGDLKTVWNDDRTLVDHSTLGAVLDFINSH